MLPTETMEETMDKTDSEITNDVLHSDNPTKLTPEEIAKAVAHHNRHHSKDDAANAPSQPETGKKNTPAKAK